MRAGRLSKEEALSFILTHLVVEKSHAFEMNQATLFEMMNMASEAEAIVNREDGAIPHEVIESLAAAYLDKTS